MEITDSMVIGEIKGMMQVEPEDEQGQVISSDANYPQEYSGMGIGSYGSIGTWSSIAVVYTGGGEKADRLIAEGMLHAYVNYKSVLRVLDKLLSGAGNAPSVQAEARRLIKDSKRVD